MARLWLQAVRIPTVRLWDLEHPSTAPIILSGHDDTVYSVAFSPDGKNLASGSDDGSVGLWDLVAPDALPIVLRGHKGGVRAVAFSLDSKTLVSGSWDKTVRSWNWRTENLAEMVCKKVWRNLTIQEWRQFVSPDIPYERTCPELPEGK